MLLSDMLLLRTKLLLLITRGRHDINTHTDTDSAADYHYVTQLT